MNVARFHAGKQFPNGPCSKHAVKLHKQAAGYRHKKISPAATSAALAVIQFFGAGPGSTIILRYAVSCGVPLSVTSQITWKRFPAASGGTATIAWSESPPEIVTSFS